MSWTCLIASAQGPIRKAAQRSGHAGDPHCVVSDSLELACDVLDRHEITQVARHRLLGRDDHEHLLANLAEELVQVLIVPPHVLRGVGVPRA